MNQTFPISVLHPSLRPLGYERQVYCAVYGEPTIEPEGQRYLYGGKEREHAGGRNAYDFGARSLTPYGRWGVVDSEAESFYPYSPYCFCAGDPINHIDPDGRKVNILGSESASALSQLQTKVGDAITLKMGDNGCLTYELANPDKKLKGDAKRIVGIIKDENITVNLNTTNGHTTSTGNMFTGGAFMGNEVTINEDKTVTVVAQQDVNPEVLKTMSDAHNKPGADMFHELTEAYAGAQISAKKKKSSPKAGDKGSVYEKAHRKASRQSGPVYYRFLDNDGNEIRSIDNSAPPNASSLEWYVNDKKGNPVVIRTYP